MEQFEAIGADVDSHVGFTPDPLHSITRIAGEEEVDAVLRVRPVHKVERILVPLREKVDYETLMRYVINLVENTAVHVTLLDVTINAHVAAPDGENDTE
ncbi:MAG: hypothetical protein ACNA8W_03045 [Bradymonadaceae bacterium]